MGITILYPTGEKERDIDLNASLSLDIVSVHGLNGHSINTWTEPKSRKLWLRDFLPGDIPRARIMTFGYNATPAFENSLADIEDHARDLLRCLRECRELDTEIKRPLIFIGHSLGGLVIKQALVSSPNSSAYTPIYQSTIGTIFFGTPHRGSSLATYGALFARIPTALALKPSPQLLTALSQGNAALDELTDKYKEHMDERPYKAVTFYETKAMTGLRNLIVTKESAVLSSPSKICLWETQVPVPAHHRDMCRFSSSNNSTYKTAVQSIQGIRQGGTSVQVENEYYTVPHMVNSHFTGRDDIRRRLTDTLLPTINRVEREQLRFVLYGLGGSGKTQICLKFAQDYKDRFWGIFWIDASSSQTAEDDFLSIARSGKVRPQRECIKQFLSTKEHWLLIIDNADDPGIDISRYFPLGTKGTILITTRNPDLEKHATAGAYHVDRMEKADAVALLLKTSALGNIEGNEDAQQARIAGAENVVEALGCLALAIIQAGAVIRQRMVALDAFCELYSKHRKELLESGRPESSIEDKRSVYTTWEISITMIEKIEEEHALAALELLRVFSFMHFTGICQSMFEGSCNDDGIASRGGFEYEATPLSKMMPSGWDPLLLGRALRLLASFSLVNVDDHGRISMHPLVHQWSRDRMSADERDSAWNTTVTTLSMASPWSYWPEAIRMRTMLLPHINACLSDGEDQLFVSEAGLKQRLCAALMFARAYRQVSTPGVMDLTRKTLSGIERELPPGHEYHLMALSDLAHDAIALGRYQEAVWLREKELQLLKKDNTRIPYDLAVGAYKLADAYNHNGEHQKSIDICDSTMAESVDVLGEDNLVMICLLETKGISKRLMYKLKEAREDLEKAWGLRKKKYGNGSASLGPDASFVLAEIYIELKQPKKARMLFNLHIHVMEDIFGPNSLCVIKAMERRDTVLFGKPRAFFFYPRVRAKRIASAEESIRIYRNHDGETPLIVLQCMENLAWDYNVSGWPEKAIPLQEEVVRRNVQQYGERSYAAIRASDRLKNLQRWAAFRRAVYCWLPKKYVVKTRLRI